MAKSFKVLIVTPDKTAYEGDCVSANIPGLAGYIGVWANHAPLIGAVVPGMVELKVDEMGSLRRLSVGTGFVEINDNIVKLMVDTCELDEEIDVERAEQALARARERLRSMERDLDRERARLALDRAQARLKATQKPK